MTHYLISFPLSILLGTIPVVAFADSSSPVAEMVLRGATGLGLCLAVFSIGVFLIRRVPSQGQNTKKEIVISERVALSAKTNVTLIEIRGQAYLMVSGSEHVSVTKIPVLDSAMERDELSIIPSGKLFRVGGE